MPTRAEQRDMLMIELGMLLAPIRALLTDPNWQQRLPYVRSQFHKEYHRFFAGVTEFCVLGELRFDAELDAIQNIHSSFNNLMSAWESSAHIRERAPTDFVERVRQARDSIRRVPCEDPGVILPSKSPYATYLRLGALFRGAQKRLQLFDPYLDGDTFHRYLRSFPDGVRVTLVTSSDIVGPTAKDQKRSDRVISISELLSIEFPDSYEFRVSSEEHDRHLRVDDEILHLGGSVKDAAKSKYYTISELTNESTHTSLDGIIDHATEWYGPNVKTHRRS